MTNFMASNILATPLAFASILLTALLPAPVSAEPETEILLEDFEDLSAWTVNSSPNVDVEIAQDRGESGMGMRLDFDFHEGSGFVIARLPLNLTLPENYSFSFEVKGDAPENALEIKIVDASGANVWWNRRSDFQFPKEWQSIITKKRHFRFAWGPEPGSVPQQLGALEIAISSGNGGRGSVWIDSLKLRPWAPAGVDRLRPEVRASTAIAGREPTRLFDPEAAGGWRSGSISEAQWLQMDLLALREYGGLIIDWDPEDYARSYGIEISDDGQVWRRIYSETRRRGGRDFVYLPDTESRYLRLTLHKSSRGNGYAIHNLSLQPYSFSSSPNTFFAAVARESAPGLYPRYFSDQQSYWTVAGIDGDSSEALINQEGMVELAHGEYSIEPFIELNGRLLTWHDVQLAQSLAEGDLPIPSVTWTSDTLRLTITALAFGKPGSSSLLLRYELHNLADTEVNGDLVLALRPFQVNPPWQALNGSGGVGRIQEIAYRDRVVRINGRNSVRFLEEPESVGATALRQGDIVDYLLESRLPEETAAEDPSGFVAAGAQFRFGLPPGGTRSFHVEAPLSAPDDTPVTKSGLADPDAVWQAAFRETSAAWRASLNRVEITLPEPEHAWVDSLRTTLAYMLINRDGAALQPGSRAYARSWIRDGMATSVALLQMGHTKPVRDFIQWYATYLFPDGKVPCCIDERGADTVDEHDSPGQWIHLIDQYYRYTRDVGFLTTVWPTVQRVVDYVVRQRALRLTDDFNEGRARLFRGLMPESISHEGYASNPVHSYWDDFFVLRGLQDAAHIATVLGYEDEAARFDSEAESFARDLKASIALSMKTHGTDFVPGAAELGDFDATSTAIAVLLGIDHRVIARSALRTTLDRYRNIFTARMDPAASWRGYTAYELRVAAACIRLRCRAEALTALRYFVEDQRPPAWNQWPEVSWRDPLMPRFIGDIPHTWVGAEYIQAIRSLLVFERAADQSLVLAAGIPAAWIDHGAGVAVRRLPTEYGVLHYRLHRTDPDRIEMQIDGDLTMPPGGIRLRPPLTRPVVAVTVNGVPTSVEQGDEIPVTRIPATVVVTNEPTTPPMAGEPTRPVAYRPPASTTDAPW